MFESTEQRVWLPAAESSIDNISDKIRQARNDINSVVMYHDISRDDCSSLTKTEINPYALMSALLGMQDILDSLDRENSQTKTLMNTTNQIVGDNLGYMKSKMHNHISYIHECVNCGHALEVPENNGVFNCKYCGSVYAIGPTRISCEY